jgi:hypothetical protein
MIQSMVESQYRGIKKEYKGSQCDARRTVIHCLDGRLQR